MSNGVAKEGGADRQGLPALEAIVGRTIEEMRQLRERAAGATRKSADLEAMLAQFQEGSDSPTQMKVRLDRLEAENHDLRGRITQARETVERLLARVQFLEDQR